MKQPKNNYFPELDALRTFALLLTLIAHYFPAVGWKLIPYSWYGVDIFFTISGFLISYTLLRVSQGSQSKLIVLKNFVIRRCLRLFPIYYLFLLFFFLSFKYLNLYMWKPEYTSWFFTYLPNFLFYKKGMGFAPGFSHLWSLGVEEQFYLIWPFVVVFLSVKKFPYAIIFFILIGIATHVLFYRVGDVRLLPFGNFHTLGVGALLAYFHFYFKLNDRYQYIIKKKVTIFATTFSILVLVLVLFREGSWVWQLFRESTLMLASFSFVLMSIHGWPRYLRWLTANNFVQYIGRISYGIYLYHLPVPYFYILIKEKTGLFLEQPILILILYTLTTVFLAAFSHRYIEQRFLNLKERFA